MTTRTLARAINRAPSTVSEYAQRGMPMDTAENARRWIRQSVGGVRKPTTPAAAESTGSPARPPTDAPAHARKCRAVRSALETEGGTAMRATCAAIAQNAHAALAYFEAGELDRPRALLELIAEDGRELADILAAWGDADDMRAALAAYDGETA